MELRAHGFPEAAREMAEHTLDRLPPNPPQHLMTRWYLGTLMLVADRHDDALALYADLASAYPDNAFFVGSHGAMAAYIDRPTDSPAHLPATRGTR